MFDAERELLLLLAGIIALSVLKLLPSGSHYTLLWYDHCLWEHCRSEEHRGNHLHGICSPLICSSWHHLANSIWPVRVECSQSTVAALGSNSRRSSLAVRLLELVNSECVLNRGDH
jgi:hypothetical protein